MLLANRCVVWWSNPSACEERHETLLDSAERARRSRFLRREDRERFTVGAAMLRLVVAEATGISPEQVRIDRRCHDCGQSHGRPALTGTGLYASVSHSGDRVVVALTGKAPVGVDVEAIRPGIAAELEAEVLGDGELAVDAPGFFAIWIRKEAALKATGDGLRVSLRKVLVSGPHEPPRLRRYSTRRNLALSIFDLTPGPGYMSALAIATEDPVEVSESYLPPLQPTAPP